jgi:hypothetical protein
MPSVVWSQTALDELSDLWVKADPAVRALITETTELLDRRLRTNAIGSSESRSGTLRIVLSAPLGASFQIEDDKTVLVVHIWLFGKRGRSGTERS